MIPIIIFFSFVIFGLTGFGSALVAMPLLIPLVGVETAAPLFASLAITAEFIMLLRYRRTIQFGAVWRLMVGSVIAIPIGLTLAWALDQRLVLTLLGIIIAGYGLYNLFRPHLPQIENPNWAFPFGFLGGMLSGAYNTGGPPIVIYGNLSRWSPTEFKSNLQGLFLLNSVMVTTSHLISGHMTKTVVDGIALGLPGMLIGLVVGWRLEKYVNPDVFRKIVLVLLVIVGLRLVASEWL
jgi:uncharacterized membrane protein YfcA